MSLAELSVPSALAPAPDAAPSEPPGSAAASDASMPAELARTYRAARLGYALVPAIAAVLVAIPIAALLCTALVRHQPLGVGNAWVIVFLIPAALLILASWIRFEKPKGLPLDAKDAPELFALIDQVRSLAKAPTIDAVYVTSDFAAKAVQRPSRGLFGGYRNELVIGLPLLQSVSKAEAAVLIAHELGHLSRRQGIQALYVHRARLTWQHVLDEQSRQPLYLRWPLSLIASGFGRRFLALSAGSERAAEFAADALAAEIAGSAVVASALQRLSIAEAFLSEYWKRVGEEPVTSPEPALRPFREMANFLPRMSEWEAAANVLEQALAEPSAPAQPSLSERLDALNVMPDLPANVSQSAIVLLGSAEGRVLDHFDGAWRMAAAPAWRKAYETLPATIRRQMDLDGLAESHSLDLKPAIERARLAYQNGGIEEAAARYDELLRWHAGDGHAWLAALMAHVDAGSGHATALLKRALELAPRTDWTLADAQDWFAVGEALLASGDDLGIDCLEQAIRIDSSRTDLAGFMVDRYLDQSASAASAA
jgi:Zn-dependent protease with chaperone function